MPFHEMVREIHALDGVGTGKSVQARVQSPAAQDGKDLRRTVGTWNRYRIVIFRFEGWFACPFQFVQAVSSGQKL
jgi:hypothetical protein